MTELRTWDKFADAQRRYDTGLLGWEPEAVAGYEFDVWEELASVEVGGDFGGAVLSVSADSFGTFVRRLVEDGAEVRPGQAIAEVAYRDPTLAEYTKVWKQARRAEDRVYDLEHESPWRAFRRAWKGRNR